jgi:hypothetical protein
VLAVVGIEYFKPGTIVHKEKTTTALKEGKKKKKPRKSRGGSGKKQDTKI